MINTSRFSSKQSKTLVLQDESTQITKIVHVSVNVDEGSIQLMQVLNEILSDAKQKTIKCYDFSRDVYIQINSKDGLVPMSFMINNPSNIILLKINRLEEQLSAHSSTSLFSIENDAKSQNSSMKKERSKERVIFEVIEIVKRWRQLHYAKNDRKKKSLQQAAQIVGLPKKSLDDYYYQLRLGQKYDFDFKAHLFDRIGVLRNYLKIIKQSPLYDRSEKHPKKLKILDEFDVLSEQYKILDNQAQKQQQLQMEFQQMQEQLQDINGRPQNQQFANPIYEDVISEESNKQYYNTFFNQFQHLMNQKDPFLFGDYDFKKKNNGLEDDYFYF